MAVAHDINQKKRTCDIQISENVDFSGLLLSDSVLHGLKSCGFIRPSPIQLKAIPLGRCGLDLIVQAKSGTGKTCVFTVVALESIKLESSALQIVVLAPTREIAVQIWDVVTGIGKAMPGLACHTFIGGLPLQQDKAKLKKCHIAIGTPGRIKQLIELEVMKTKNVRMLILDEADKLLEADFQQQINWIYSTLPENKQMLALSATYPEYLAEHLTKYMRNPTFLRLNITDPTLLGVKQYYLMVPFHPLPNKSFHLKSEAVVRLLSSMTFQQCLIFSNLQSRANNLATELKSQGWPTACIAGSLEQTKRLAAMDELRSYQCRILISTDLTSRGIDADKVDLIIHLDVPKEHETYLHRTGRAGRYGSFGASVVIVSAGQEKTELEAVEEKCHTHILPLPDPIPMDLTQQELPADLSQTVTTETILTCPASSVQPDSAVRAHSPGGSGAGSSGSPTGSLHQEPQEVNSSDKSSLSLDQAETIPVSSREVLSQLQGKEVSSPESVVTVNGHVSEFSEGEDAHQSSSQESCVQLADKPEEKSKRDSCHSPRTMATSAITPQSGVASCESGVSVALTGENSSPATGDMTSAGNKGDALCAFVEVPQSSSFVASEEGKHQNSAPFPVCRSSELAAERPPTRPDVDGHHSPSEEVDSRDASKGSSCRTGSQLEDSAVQEEKRLFGDLTRLAPSCQENMFSSSFQKFVPKFGNEPVPNIFSVLSKKSVVTLPGKGVQASAFSSAGSGSQSQFSFSKSFPLPLSFEKTSPAPDVSDSFEPDLSKRKRTQNIGGDFLNEEEADASSKRNSQEQPDTKGEERGTIAHTQAAARARKTRKALHRRKKDHTPFGVVSSAWQFGPENPLKQLPIATNEKQDIATANIESPGLPQNSPGKPATMPQRLVNDDTERNKSETTVSRSRPLVKYDEDWFDPSSSRNSSRGIVDLENSKAAVLGRSSSEGVGKPQGKTQLEKGTPNTNRNKQSDLISNDKEKLGLNSTTERAGDNVATSGRNSDKGTLDTAVLSTGRQCHLTSTPEPDPVQVKVEPPTVKPSPRRQLVSYNDDWLEPGKDTVTDESFGSACLKTAGGNKKKSKPKKHRNQQKKGESKIKQEPAVAVQKADAAKPVTVSADVDKQHKRINGSVVTVPPLGSGYSVELPPLPHQEVKLKPSTRQKLFEALFSPASCTASQPDETESSLQKAVDDYKVKVMEDGSVQVSTSPLATTEKKSTTQAPEDSPDKAVASALAGTEKGLPKPAKSYKCKPNWVTSELEDAVSKILNSAYGNFQRQCQHLRGAEVVGSKAEKKSEDMEAALVSKFDQDKPPSVKAQPENGKVSAESVESLVVTKTEYATHSKSASGTSIEGDDSKLSSSLHIQDTSETTHLLPTRKDHAASVTADTLKDSNISLNKAGDSSKPPQPHLASSAMGVAPTDVDGDVTEHLKIRTSAGTKAQIVEGHENEKNPSSSTLHSTGIPELEESRESVASGSDHPPAVSQSRPAKQSQPAAVRRKARSRHSHFLLTPFLSQLNDEASQDTASKASMDFMKSLHDKQKEGIEPKLAAQAVEKQSQVAGNVKPRCQDAKNSKLKKPRKKPSRRAGGHHKAEPCSQDSESDSDTETDSTSTSSSSSSSSLSWGHHIRNCHFSESALPQDHQSCTAKSVRPGRVAKRHDTRASPEYYHRVSAAGSQARGRSGKGKTGQKKIHETPREVHASEGFDSHQMYGVENYLSQKGRSNARNDGKRSKAKTDHAKEPYCTDGGGWCQQGDGSTSHYGNQYDDHSYQNSSQYPQSSADYYNYWDNGNSSYQAYNKSRSYENVEDEYLGAGDAWGYSRWGGEVSQMYGGHDYAAQTHEGVSQGWWDPGMGTYDDHSSLQQDWHSQGWDYTESSQQNYNQGWDYAGNGHQDYTQGWDYTGDSHQDYSQGWDNAGNSHQNFNKDWVPEEVRGDPVAWYLHKALQARLRETRQQRWQQKLNKEKNYQTDYIAMMVKGAKNGFRM